MELQKVNKGGLIMEKKLSIITGNIEKVEQVKQQQSTI